MSNFPVAATVAKGRLQLVVFASANGICDLEPIQDMLIFRTKSTALLVLAASPRQSYQSWEEEIKGKGTSKVSPVRSEAFQHCTIMTHFILANLSLARSYFCHGMSSRSFQSNWVLWHLCDIFGFLWVIGMDEVREENLQFTWKWCWGLVTAHPVTTRASAASHEMLQFMQNILPLFAQGLAPPSKAKTRRSITTSPLHQILRLLWLPNLSKLCLLLPDPLRGIFMTVNPHLNKQ